MESALRTARSEQRAWAALSLSQRLAPVARLRARLALQPEGLGQVVAEEIGKTLWEAIATEVMPLAEACAFLLNRAPRLLAPRREKLVGTMPFTGTAEIHHRPWGTVALLVPWNYPLFLCAGTALNALAAGNAVALKASPRAKRTVEAFGRWLVEAGFPPGLAPVLDSSDDAGRALAASPLVDRIVFTGSSKTGRSVLTAAAQNLVPATIELSGFDAVFVMRDANIDLAADAISWGVRLNAGRTCICPRRLFVEAPVADKLLAKLSERLRDNALLSPMDPQTLREADALADALENTSGTTNLNGRARGDANKALLYGGGAEALKVAQGNFVPALVSTAVADLDAMFALENQTDYALGGSIFTRNLNRARQIAAQLRPGMLAVNECVAPAGEPAVTFGGRGESGYGTRAGDEGLLEMTRPQAICFANGTYRPHHHAGPSEEGLVRALLRMRHAPGIFTRMKGAFDYAMEGARFALRPKKTK